MGKDGVPYCEKDFQKSFGVKCAHCNRYISGKVLQAGDNHHFHPTCARCTKCGDPFGDGEEMYLQGGAIWHPRCGPGPSSEAGILNGVDTNGFNTETEFDRTSTSGMSEIQVSARGGGRQGTRGDEMRFPCVIVLLLLRSASKTYRAAIVSNQNIEKRGPLWSRNFVFL